MVSHYRNIIELLTSPSPFFDTNSDSSARRKSLENSSSFNLKTNNKHSNLDNQSEYDTYSKISKTSSLSLNSEENIQKIDNDNFSNSIENEYQNIKDKDFTNNKSNEDNFEDLKQTKFDSNNQAISSIQLNDNQKNDDLNDNQIIDNQDRYVTDELAKYYITNVNKFILFIF